MQRVRAAAVAGTFYPADPGRLRADLTGLLDAAIPDDGPAPAALIVPHAGYVYSGPVAASAYALLARHSGDIERVVMIGPAHFAATPGLALPGADALDTPLGTVPVDADAEERAGRHGTVVVSAETHRHEHSLEVQLPFLQVTLGRLSVAALLTGRVEPLDVAQVIGDFLGRRSTLVVISSDLSHYLDYATARRLDAATAEAILELRPEDLGPDSACGRVGVQALLLAVRRAGLTARLLDLRNSGDTAGPKDRVVGYGAFAFS